jgi:type II secretory ATPase GspE/PulE/Tfp pilus assembly ATPase PilB-like protein
MIAGTFNLVIAQRLARKICTNCAKEIDVKSDERR